MISKIAISNIEKKIEKDLIEVKKRYPELTQEYLQKLATQVRQVMMIQAGAGQIVFDDSLSSEEKFNRRLPRVPYNSKFSKLVNVWFQSSQRPGWLRSMEENKILSLEELKEIEQIDERAIALTKEAQREFYEGSLERQKEQKEFAKEITEQIGAEEMKELKLQKIDADLLKLQTELDRIYGSYEESVQKDSPFWLRNAVKELNNPQEVEKQIRSLKTRRYLTENPNVKGKNWIGTEEIATARLVPFDSLLQFSRGFAKCPFHEEKTASFHFQRKKNRGYCFGCHWSGDTIDFLMQQNKISFPEAVRSLIQ